MNVLFSMSAVDTATDVLLGEFECGSEVTGIQFNAQLKQVATSHNAAFPEVYKTHAVNGFYAICVQFSTFK